MDRTEPKLSTESAGTPVALATGADKGIVLETARRLAGAGYRVYLTIRSGERGRAAAATAGAVPGTGRDLRESVRHAAGGVERAEGHPDVLVNKPASPARCATTRTTTEPAA
jgi:NAD(P)-dependent dehydrogenase (short-subunit alcohol dehydrogenase family)